MNEVMIYTFWAKVTKTVFPALREHEEFFVLFQRETLKASLGNQPVSCMVINYLQQNSLFLNF